ncbi:unnamed protein product [Rotaria sordida]|uniref:Uncharacterized protein n=1 Tax=Rotaria sordida TaxID=392033 RepID=A0A814B731_9BILA|nr:unnamed protein product [Rotaria sordida]CAF0924485.1 unnamed protein product [Rotaria sordida]
MLKLLHILIFIVICLIEIVYNQLIIQPAESIVSRYQFKPFIALCTGQKSTRVVTWRSPSQIDIEEDNNARITVERKRAGLRLRIRNLTENDQGIWKCLGFDQDGKSFSNTLQIVVKIPITFLSEPIQYAELNSAVLIKCRVISNPSAEISWFKGQNRIELLSSNYEQTNDGLKINRVSSIDNDIFWCQADVIETGESKDYQIQVILAQAITSSKITCISPCAVEKRTGTLICEANGIPSPQFSWFYGQNDHAMINGVSKYIIRGNRLIINYVDQTDSGRYSCHTFNDFDKKGQKTEYILNVIIPPYLLPISPIEISIDENFPLKQVGFICRVERASIDSLSLEWLYANNTSVQAINGISIDTTQLTTQRLIKLNFSPIRREHHGNYTCLAKNLADVTSTVAQLIVKYKPVFIEPKMIDVYSVPNYRAIMKCQIDSYPPPVIQWVKIIQEHDINQVILEDNHPQVIDIFTKQIGSTFYETQLTYNPSEEDFGLNFECRANNSRIEKHSITLQHAEPPGPVRVPEIKPRSNTIELNVQPSLDIGGLPLLQYIVKYEQIDVPNSLRTISFPVVSNQSQTIEIKSLQAASLYRIQVAAENHAGQSVFSIPIQAKTFSGEVPQFSLSNASCLNHQSCLIKWFIEYDGGSTISRAEIFYAIIDGTNKVGKLSKPIHIEPYTTEYEFKELKPKTNYLIIVRLFNTAGYSEEKIRIMTDSTSICKTGCPSKPSVFIIAIIITGIIIGATIIFILLILNRVLLTRHGYRNPKSSRIINRRITDDE